MFIHTRIGKVIRLSNDISFPENPKTSEMISMFLKHTHTRARAHTHTHTHTHTLSLSPFIGIDDSTLYPKQEGELLDPHLSISSLVTPYDIYIYIYIYIYIEIEIDNSLSRNIIYNWNPCMHFVANKITHTHIYIAKLPISKSYWCYFKHTNTCITHVCTATVHAFNERTPSYTHIYIANFGICKNYRYCRPYLSIYLSW